MEQPKLVTIDKLNCKGFHFLSNFEVEDNSYIAKEVAVSNELHYKLVKAWFKSLN